MADLPSYLPSETFDHDDEHELKLRVEPRAPIAPIVGRIERLAAEEGEAAHETLAGDIGEAFGIDEISGIKGIAHIDRFSMYHDTRALDLYRSDASLRTRRRGNGKCRVNAKRYDGRGGARGCVVRREWRYTLAPDVFDFLERSRFRPLVEHHFGELLGRRGEARLCLSPVVQIHKRSTRIEFSGAGGQQFLLSLDRFRGFDCRTHEITRSTRELREIEIEALNGKASRELESIREPVSRLPGIALGRPKYQVLVEALGIHDDPAAAL